MKEIITSTWFTLLIGVPIAFIAIVGIVSDLKERYDRSKFFNS